MTDGETRLDGGQTHDIQGAEQAANMLRALANPHRLMILKLLERTPHNVMDLCDRLNLRQSLASQHLARLRLDGIVTAERQGHHVVYSLGEGKARQILTLISDMMPPHGEKAAKTQRRNGHANGGGVAPDCRP